MKELHEQQAADELRTLNEAEIEAVSGGEINIDMGYFGRVTITEACMSWSMDVGDYGWMTVGECA